MSSQSEQPAFSRARPLERRLRTGATFSPNLPLPSRYKGPWLDHSPIANRWDHRLLGPCVPHACQPAERCHPKPGALLATDGEASAVSGLCRCLLPVIPNPRPSCGVRDLLFSFCRVPRTKFSKRTDPTPQIAQRHYYRRYARLPHSRFVRVGPAFLSCLRVFPVCVCASTQHPGWRSDRVPRTSERPASFECLPKR